MDAALGRSSRRLQLPGGHAPRAPLRAPGSAMGTSANSSTALASCSRVARATMIAGSFLLVSARGDRGRRARGSPRRRAPGAGRVPGPGLRGARGPPGWVGVGVGVAERAGRGEGTRVVWGSHRAQPGLWNEGELFSSRSGCAGGGARGGPPASCAFRGFSRTSGPLCPHPLHTPAQAPAAAPSAWRGAGAAGRGAGGGGRRCAAAAVSCRDATAVGERFRCAPAAGDLGASARCLPERRAGRPSPTSPPRLGWVAVSACPKKDP